MSDIPIQRTIKVGNATVGLMGVDVALSQAVSRNNLTENEIVAYLFAEIKKKNYIPSGAAGLYKEALLREYKKLRGEETAPEEKRLQVRILGPGCVSCNKLGTLLFEIFQEMHIAADIEQIHDLDEIWRHGVLSTPALIINDEIKCAGKMPTRAEVEQWVRDVID